tara:strand:- start:3703 stop:4494 length:792 start_codon:yes stop_codon:yes gene_type:complete
MSDLVKVGTSVLGKLATEELDLLKNEICKGATDSELVYFLKVCSSLNLNPFTKQIYSLPFSGGRVVVIGIDGLSTIAHRTNEYVGCGPATFHFKNPNDKEPLSAEVTVYRMRNGIKGEFTAKVFMDEYKPKFKAPMWDKFPKRMLEKCAHALALKKGFNEEMTGLYTTEEMDQAKNDMHSEGKIIDLETLAQKEKSFDQRAYIDLIKSYCAVKTQEGVDKPVNLIIEHLGHEIMSDEANKTLLINMEEKAKKDLMIWLENELK